MLPIDTIIDYIVLYKLMYFVCLHLFSFVFDIRFQSMSFENTIITIKNVDVFICLKAIRIYKLSEISLESLQKLFLFLSI